MKRYKALQPVTLMAGSIRVTDAQAKRRQHCLQPLGAGEYLITGACNFKAGEEFYCLDMGKHPGILLLEDTQAEVEVAKRGRRPRKK
jgi:hypothetical protein